jgi:hypothetical protein
VLMRRDPVRRLETLCVRLDGARTKRAQGAFQTFS